MNLSQAPTATGIGSVAPSRDRVDVWWCTPDEIAGPDAVAACERLLAPEERSARDRFRFARHRHEYLVTRALARTALSLYAAVAPEAWQFRRTEHGRPEIAGPVAAPPLRFSLSNTGGLVACGVTLAQEVGVDVEDTARRVELLELADRFFSGAEASDLRSLAPERRRARFFEYWTLKEAYIKGRGMGLSLPLDGFAFRLSDAGTIDVAFGDGIDDDPRTWQFRLFRPLERFTLAVGVRRGVRSDVEVRLAHFVPLAAGGAAPERGPGRRA